MPRYHPPPSEGPIVKSGSINRVKRLGVSVGVAADVAVVVGPEIGVLQEGREASQATPIATLSDRYAMRYDAVTSDASSLRKRGGRVVEPR